MPRRLRLGRRHAEVLSQQGVRDCGFPDVRRAHDADEAGAEAGLRRERRRGLELRRVRDAGVVDRGGGRVRRVRRRRRRRAVRVKYSFDQDRLRAADGQAQGAALVL